MLKRRPQEHELMTVGKLREELDGLPEDGRIIFGCESLRFYRIKQRGEKFFQIEFDQTIGDDDQGRVYVYNVE